MDFGTWLSVFNNKEITTDKSLPYHFRLIDHYSPNLINFLWSQRTFSVRQPMKKNQKRISKKAIIRVVRSPSSILIPQLPNNTNDAIEIPSTCHVNCYQRARRYPYKGRIKVYRCSESVKQAVWLVIGSIAENAIKHSRAQHEDIGR